MAMLPAAITAGFPPQASLPIVTDSAAFMQFLAAPAPIAIAPIT
jgi:hypothetical protein